MALQRDVPQYIAMPWFITCVIARTISAGKKSKYENSAEPDLPAPNSPQGTSYVASHATLPVHALLLGQGGTNTNSVTIKRSVPKLFEHFYQLAVV